METFIEQFNWDGLLNLLGRVAGVFLCLTVHETCHGLAACALGDPTAKRMQRLSLNPLHHIDWLGLASMVICGFGWAKPVPVDMRYFKNPRLGMAFTALAGPVSNFLLALLLPVYIGSAALLLNSAGPTTVQDMLWEIPAMSLIAIASQILAVTLLEACENSFSGILSWLAVMLFLPKLFLAAGIILPFGNEPVMAIAMWMPANFIPAGTNVNMSECATIWDTGAGMARCLISGTAGILVFSAAGVLLLRKKDI